MTAPLEGQVRWTVAMTVGGVKSVKHGQKQKTEGKQQCWARNNLSRRRRGWGDQKKQKLHNNQLVGDTQQLSLAVKGQRRVRISWTGRRRGDNEKRRGPSIPSPQRNKPLPRNESNKKEKQKCIMELNTPEEHACNAAKLIVTTEKFIALIRSDEKSCFKNKCSSME